MAVREDEKFVAYRRMEETEEDFEERVLASPEFIAHMENTKKGLQVVREKQGYACTRFSPSEKVRDRLRKIALEVGADMTHSVSWHELPAPCPKDPYRVNYVWKLQLKNGSMILVQSVSVDQMMKVARNPTEENPS